MMGNKNNTIKILAVCFAMIMWIYVMSEVNPRTTKQFNDIKVVIKNTEYVDQQGLAIMEPTEITVDVEVAGRRNDILKITEKDISAFADLRGISKKGESRIPIYVNSLENVSIENVYPEDALVRLEPITTKDKPVIVKKVGKVKEGYSDGEAVSKPNTVFVKGPKSWVDSVVKVVATVDISGYDSDISVNVPFKALDENGKEVRAVIKEPEIIEVKIPVYSVKSVPIKPQIEGESMTGYVITGMETNLDTVEIRGYKEALEEVSSIRTTPVDVSLISEDTVNAVELIIPDGVELLYKDISPELNIKVEKIVEKTLTYKLSDINIINIESGLKVDSNLENTLDITIRGVESIINKVTKKDLNPIIDLEGLTEGVYSIKVDIKDIEDIEIIDKENHIYDITLIKKDINIDNNEGNNEGEETNNDNTSHIKEDENI